MPIRVVAGGNGRSELEDGRPAPSVARGAPSFSGGSYAPGLIQPR
jgi:hypothetical protein